MKGLYAQASNDMRGCFVEPISEGARTFYDMLIKVGAPKEIVCVWNDHEVTYSLKEMA